MSYQLTIKPLTPTNIPPEEEILKVAKELIDGADKWSPGKRYNKGTTKTFSRGKQGEDGAKWHCRVSEHTKEEATFDEVWAKLGADKAQNEMQFIPNIKKVTLVKAISPSQSIWTLYYHFAPPISARVFTVLQVVQLDETTPRTGIVVSIPVDVTGDPELAKLEEKGVKGRYVSVERVRELDDGRIEWRMATSSTPGGSIPQAIAESSMGKQISADVPHFMHWLQTTRSNKQLARNGSAPSEMKTDDPQVAHLPTAEDKGNEALPNAEAAPQVGGGGMAAI